MGVDLSPRKYFVAKTVEANRPTHALKAATSNFTLNHLPLSFNFLQEFRATLYVSFRDGISNELVEGVLIVVVAICLQFRIGRPSPGNKGRRYVYLILVVRKS